MAVDYCIIGSRLKQARIKAGLTQQELAEQTNLSVAFISRIERGSSHINLKRLSEILYYIKCFRRLHFKWCF